MKDKEWTKIGVVSVDAGLMMIGDPCYTVGKPSGNAWATKDWEEFCRNLFDSERFEKDQVECIPFVLGHEGAAVITSTGFGDGDYDVLVKYSDEGDWGRRVAEVKVVFIYDEETMK